MSILGCPASELSFNTMLKWPSEGGTLTELRRLLQGAPHKATGDLVTVGLVTGGDPLADPNDRKFGDVTGLLHFIGNETHPAYFYEEDWGKLIEVENHGRVPGIYGINYPEVVLVVLPEWKTDTIWRSNEIE